MLDMLALVTVIEPKITRDPSNLNLKSATLKTMKGLQQWIDVHVTQSPYHVIIGKYCQVAGAQKCAACKPVKMETAIWILEQAFSTGAAPPEPRAFSFA